MNTFKCEICNEDHGFLYGINAETPDLFNSLSEEERAVRINEIRQNTYLVDGETIFFKADLNVGILK